MGIVFLVFSIICNTAANGIFKAAAIINDEPIRKYALAGLGLFIGLLNTLAYIKALDSLTLSKAYPVFSAASTILIAGVSFYYFNESVSIQKLLGLGVICTGMLLLWNS